MEGGNWLRMKVGNGADEKGSWPSELRGWNRVWPYTRGTCVMVSTG